MPINKYKLSVNNTHLYIFGRTYIDIRYSFCIIDWLQQKEGLTFIGEHNSTFHHVAILLPSLTLHDYIFLHLTIHCQHPLPQTNSHSDCFIRNLFTPYDKSNIEEFDAASQIYRQYHMQPGDPHSRICHRWYADGDMERNRRALNQRRRRRKVPTAEEITAAAPWASSEDPSTNIFAQSLTKFLCVSMLHQLSGN